MTARAYCGCVKRRVKLDHVRPWPDFGLVIGDCVRCGSTHTVEDDPLAAARGIVHGILLSLPLWSLLIVGILALVNVLNQVAK